MRYRPINVLAAVGLAVAAWLSLPAMAGEVQVQEVRLVAGSGGWTAHVTLRHADTGWDHYADAWRVVDAQGRDLGTRTLFHPHVTEQPFTRSLSGIAIPQDSTVVYVEAHDKVHGWSANRVMVNLGVDAGSRYRIER